MSITRLQAATTHGFGQATRPAESPTYTFLPCYRQLTAIRLFALGYTACCSQRRRASSAEPAREPATSTQTFRHLCHHRQLSLPSLIAPTRLDFPDSTSYADVSFPADTSSLASLNIQRPLEGVFHEHIPHPVQAISHKLAFSSYDHQRCCLRPSCRSLTTSRATIQYHFDCYQVDLHRQTPPHAVSRNLDYPHSRYHDPVDTCCEHGQHH